MIEFKQIKDITSLMLWREEVITDVFAADPSKELLDSNRQYYERHIKDGTHLAFVAVRNGQEAGCGSICLSEELPSPDNPDGKCAYIMNIYVRKPFRDQGVGHAIVKMLVEKAKSLACDKIYLETTSDGRPVYRSLGFRDMPDMMKYYDTEI